MSKSMDKLFDEALKEAASLSAEDMGAEILAENVDDIEFPERHVKNMEKLFARERRKIMLREFAVKLSRAAAVLVVLAVISGAAIYNVDAWRIKVMNLFSDRHETNTDITFIDGNTSYVIGDVTLKYIPDGFEVTENRQSKASSRIQFKNKDKYFIVEVNKAINKSSIDSENASFEKITVNGAEGFYSEKDGSNILSWQAYDHALNIYGNIDKDMIVTIANNIYFNQNN